PPLANCSCTTYSTVVVAVGVTRVTECVLTKRTEGRAADSDGPDEQLGEMRLSPAEQRGLRNAGLALLAVVALLVIALVPAGSPFRGEDGGVLDSPSITGVAHLLGVVVALTGAGGGRARGGLSRGR